MATVLMFAPLLAAHLFTMGQAREVRGHGLVVRAVAREQRHTVCDALEDSVKLLRLRARRTIEARIFNGSSCLRRQALQQPLILSAEVIWVAVAEE